MVVYDGTSIPKIEKNFRGAVDEYLAFCAETGKTPNIPFKGNLSVRLREGLHQRAVLFAQEHHRKLNAVINDAVEHHLSQAE